MKRERVYSEVMGILNCLGDEYKNAIPSNILNNIENGKDKNYNPVFDENEAIDCNTLEEESVALISAFYLKYWCKDEKEKEELKKIYRDNEEKYKEKYSYENLFKKSEDKPDDIKENEDECNNCKETTDIVVYKENILKRFINKIKILFKKQQN